VNGRVAITKEQRIAQLAETFPTLRGAPGLYPWKPRELEDACGRLSSGGVHAARFVLACWNSYHPWRCGPFLVLEAFGTWDDEHRAAFVAWAQDPWSA
jgi:hypothetical protein